MCVTFFVVDDDRACRSMLSEIIKGEELGRVIGFGEEGTEQDSIIIEHNPDIVLLDLLLPGQDGIEIARKLKEKNFSGEIIMISQVETKNMVAEAYEAGIVFYITKPINRIEVVSVIRQVINNLNMARSINKIKETLTVINENKDIEIVENEGEKYENSNKNLDSNIRDSSLQILSELGVMGESGVNDVCELVLYLAGVKSKSGETKDIARLQDLYMEAAKNISGTNPTESDLKAKEQRLRRVIRKAMDNLASMGLENFHDLRFEHYSGKFFDYPEIRKRMNEIKNGAYKSEARINIKKFLNAMVLEVM
ncbi:response regulator [Natranaerofaba carboxydovora]|uniref:response regulator n=1 Tax=Natranaerofaba carboxydovora TaxID=2742683 RepID=UPI001F13BC7F|nr:response regulator [Natranaerofaba carboxydovora]UMZ72789.1 Stage 0 sporulation protein A [Natranaerofaba carboxydovora]